MTGLPWLVRSERRRLEKIGHSINIIYWRFWSFLTTLNIEGSPKFCKPLTNCFSKFITSPPPFPWFLKKESQTFLRFILIKLSLKLQSFMIVHLFVRFGHFFSDTCSPLCDICSDQRSWLSDLSTSLVFPPPGQIIIITIRIIMSPLLLVKKESNVRATSPFLSTTTSMSTYLCFGPLWILKIARNMCGRLWFSEFGVDFHQWSIISHSVRPSNMF